MKNKKQVKVAIRRGNKVIVGTLTPPEKEFSRWSGRAEDGATATADTAEECADKLTNGAL